MIFRTVLDGELRRLGKWKSFATVADRTPERSHRPGRGIVVIHLLFLGLIDDLTVARRGRHVGSLSLTRHL